MFNEILFRRGLAENKITMTQLSKEISVSIPTLYRKIWRGGDFTRSEIETITELLELESPDAVFFAKAAEHE